MSAFLEILADWVSHGQLTQIRDLFENTSALRDINKRAQLVNSHRVSNDGIRTTLLLTACEKSLLEVVEFLVYKCGADVNLPGDVKINDSVVEGVPPLWLACNRNNYLLANFLIQANANVNAATKRTQSTALRAACHGGYFDIVRLLVDKGADIEQGNVKNSTCLMIACLRGQYDIVHYFLERKAPVNKSNLDGRTCLHDAAENGDVRLIKLLINHGALSKADKDGITPILVAAMFEHDDAVKLLSKGLSKDKAAEALELLGAKKICSGREKGKKKSDSQLKLRIARKSLPSNVKSGLDCWYQATSLRQSLLSGCRKKTEMPKREVYNNIVEFTTTKELANLQRDSSAVFFSALLICERILGLKHPFTYNSVREVAVHFGKLHEYSRCFKLCLHAVDIHLLDLDPFCAEAFHIFKCCVNLFFAFKVDDQPSLVDQCRPILADLFSRIMIQLDRIVGQIKTLEMTDERKRMIYGYYSLALHVLSILNEDSNSDGLFDLIEKLARIPLSQGNKVFLAISSSNKLDGIDVVEWNAVGSVSKRHLAEVAQKAFRISSQKSASIACSVLSNYGNQLSESLPVLESSEKLSSCELLNQSCDNHIDLEQYVDLKIICQGDYSRAMLAKRPVDKVPVLLKEVCLIQMNTIERRSIVHEALQLCNTKPHPHLVHFFKVFEGPDKLIIEMEYFSNGDLARLITRNRKEHNYFPEALIRVWIWQLTSALKFLHDHGLVHRNVKAKNVLLAVPKSFTAVETTFNLKLGQLGSQHKIVRYRQVNALRKKGLHLAPEIFTELPYTKKSDIWSLGILAYEMATSRLPFDDEEKIKKARIKFPSTMPYSDPLRRFVELLLNPNSEDRPESSNILSDPFLVAGR